MKSVYFYDQLSHASHAGIFARAKRDSKELQQALYHVEVQLPFMNGNSQKTETNSPISVKTQPSQTTGTIRLPRVLRKLKTPIIPEVLIEELNSSIRIYDDRSQINPVPSSSSETCQSSLISTDKDSSVNEESKRIQRSLPKVSLPSSLIIQLNSKWSDLIQNTEYEYKLWQTKAGEQAWRQYLRKKHSKSTNRKEQKNVNNKVVVRNRLSSQTSASSSVHNSNQVSPRTNAKPDFNRSMSRTSMNTANAQQDSQHLLKIANQENAEHLLDLIKNGIHIEFKLSSYMDQAKKKSHNVVQNMVLFDVPQPQNQVDIDILIFNQNKCKRLLAEMKQKIFAETVDNGERYLQVSRISYYEDKANIRNKNKFLSSKRSHRQPKSKFALAILQNTIPEKYEVNLDILEDKHKCGIEFSDGSSQLYYPSGHLAVLRLSSSLSTTLFFNDIHPMENQFLGLVTSSGNVLICNPKSHACFITDSVKDCAYLCNHITGTIEKQLPRYAIVHSERKSITTIEDDLNDRRTLQNIIQLQLNSCMQLEYHNPSNIRFAFMCYNEQFRIQLGIDCYIQSSIAKSGTARFQSEKNELAKKLQIRDTSSSSASEKLSVNKRSSINEERLSYQLPIMQELIQLRKLVQRICHNWLQEYRTILGILDISDYCLPDLSTESLSERSTTQSKKQLDQNKNHMMNAKQSKDTRILTKRTSVNDICVKLTDQEQPLRTNIEVKSKTNLIAHSIEQFKPHSTIGCKMKQQVRQKNDAKSSISSSTECIYT